MDMTITQSLERLAHTLSRLPVETQADVLAELERRVDSLAQSQMSDAQRAVVVQRLAEPRSYAGAAAVAALLQRFNPRS